MRVGGTLSTNFNDRHCLTEAEQLVNAETLNSEVPLLSLVLLLLLLLLLLLCLQFFAN